jgi:hypothetical protein
MRLIHFNHRPGPCPQLCYSNPLGFEWLFVAKKKGEDRDHAVPAFVDALRTPARYFFDLPWAFSNFPAGVFDKIGRAHV